MNTTKLTKKNFKQDAFMQFAHAQIVAKGVDEDRAWDVVFNTHVA